MLSLVTLDEFGHQHSFRQSDVCIDCLLQQLVNQVYPDVEEEFKSAMTAKLLKKPSKLTEWLCFDYFLTHWWLKRQRNDYNRFAACITQVSSCSFLPCYLISAVTAHQFSSLL